MLENKLMRTIILKLLLHLYRTRGEKNVKLRCVVQKKGNEKSFIRSSPDVNQRSFSRHKVFKKIISCDTEPLVEIGCC